MHSKMCPVRSSDSWTSSSTTALADPVGEHSGEGLATHSPLWTAGHGRDQRGARRPRTCAIWMVRRGGKRPHRFQWRVLAWLTRGVWLVCNRSPARSLAEYDDSRTGDDCHIAGRRAPPSTLLRSGREVAR